jgi:hypothetical protein
VEPGAGFATGQKEIVAAFHRRPHQKETAGTAGAEIPGLSGLRIRVEH